jgi:hypothetical protein
MGKQVMENLVANAKRVVKPSKYYTQVMVLNLKLNS